MPSRMPAVSLQLAKALPDLPNKLAQAARYALDHPDRIAFESMRSSATACQVASPTMLRLARVLGYKSYEDFRNEFQQDFVEKGFGARADALKATSESEGKEHLSKQISLAATANIERTMHLLDVNDIDAFSDSVRRSNRTFILGSGSMHWMAALMESTGEMAIPGLRTDHSGSATLVETIASITDQDTLLVFAFAPYARETVEAAAYAKQQKASIFAVTDKPSSPLVEHAERVFFVPTQSPHYYPSVVSTVLMIEILLSAAVAALDTLDRIKQTERVRNMSGAYL